LSVRRDPDGQRRPPGSSHVRVTRAYERHVRRIICDGRWWACVFVTCVLRRWFVKYIYIYVYIYIFFSSSSRWQCASRDL
jgi:hypothetical protein